MSGITDTSLTRLEKDIDQYFNLYSNLYKMDNATSTPSTNSKQINIKDMWFSYVLTPLQKGKKRSKSEAGLSPLDEL